MRSASIKTLVNALDIDSHNAKLIREIWFASDFDALIEADELRYKAACSQLFHIQLRHIKTKMINAILDTFGLEHLGWHKRASEQVYYFNAGDTYAATIILIGDNLTVGCWGDLVEKNLIEGAQ